MEYSAQRSLTRLTGRGLLLALLFVLATPVSGQNTARPYFSLRSSRTFPVGERPVINLWSRNVEALDFRVYRVNDPVKFLSNLEELQAFGGQAPELLTEKTLIERFHDFKRRWRNRVRDFFRGQYSSTARARIREWLLASMGVPVGEVSTYAQAPLLNPSQVVSTWRQRMRQGRHWNTESIPIQVHGKGLYLVEAVHEDLRAYTLVFVTDMAVITKASPGEILAYVVNRKSGEPIEGATARVWSNRRELAAFRTDKTGLISARFRESRPENTVVVATAGEDFAVSNIYSWYVSDDPERFLVGYVYTDRPVYRPGHTVHWKAILRAKHRGEYHLPESTEAHVQIEAPDRETVFRKTYTLSSMGTINDEFVLSDPAALGYYSVEMRVGDRTVRGGFHVEEYKKPEYAVRVIPEERRVLQGDPIRATIQARYYFGEPVAGADVTYVVHRSRYWYPRYYDPDDFGEGEEGYYGGDQVLLEEGELDSEGRLEITIPTSAHDKKWDLRYRIEARVTDQANREISGFSSVLVTYADFVVNIQNARYVYERGETASFNIEARDYDGNPVETPVKVELLRWYGRQSRQEVIERVEAHTDGNGVATVQLPIRESGSFRARVTAPAGKGREAWDLTYLWVSGGDGSRWGARRERVEIIPDKKSYRPGDVARVLIVTGVPDTHVLVTLEGELVHQSSVVHATEPTFTVDIPIRSKHQPGVFLSAVFIKDNRLYQGSKKMKVPPVEREITVEIVTEKEQYRPGEQASYTVITRDHTGQPISAEVSLGVVDEAIYAIRPEAAGKILDFFYGSIANHIHTGSSLSYYFHGEAGHHTMQLTELRRARAPAQLKPEELVEPEVREEFLDTVLWLADIRTGANGRARVRLKFPDNLTTWRATARAITRDTLVGSRVQKTIVRKNLLVRLVAPRFFTQGDEVTLSAVVHNYLESDKQARVSLAIEGLELLEGETRDVTVPQRGEVRVDWRVRAGTGREATLLAKALTNEESDALKWTLPIVPYGVRLYLARSGSLRGREEETEVELTFPDGIVPTSRELQLSISPSVAGTVFGALEFLIRYPYGCTEQTMSSFLPNVIVAQAMRELKLKTNVDEAELAKKVRAGLDRLYDFQHPDGGWGWWQTDDSHAFMTAYVLNGLVQASAAGYDVDSGRIGRAQRWLRDEFRRQDRARADLRAYLAYTLVLSDPANKVLLEPVWENREKLSPYGWALMGLAFEAAKDPRIEQVAGQLEGSVSEDEHQARWNLERDSLMGYHGNTTPEATAYALKFLSRVRPKNPLLPKAALWLVNHRDQGYYWSSTKQTAMVIYGLIDYVKVSGELNPDFAATAWVNGRRVFSRRFTPADARTPTPATLRLPADALATGSNKVRIRKRGAGTLYWSARAEYYSMEKKLERTGGISLNLLRDYYRLVPEQKGDKIVYRLESLEGELASGDVLAVRLTLSGGEWNYLMIEDPIPAGTEFIERDDLYDLQRKPPWWQRWYTRREFHDDHAAFFVRHFRQGQMQFFYLLKVVNPGRFRVSPARAEPMYQPQYLSTSESRIVVVK